MTYKSEVLADDPALFYYLDNEGFGTNGEAVPDLSANGLDATLTFSGSQQCWGLFPPIETDPSSSAFWGYTNPGEYGFSGTSRIERASHADLDPSGGDCAIEAWIKVMDEIPTASDFPVVEMQGTIGIMVTGAGGGATRIGGFVWDNNPTLFRVKDTSMAVVVDHLEEWFHVAVERIGNSLALYINGVLRASATITSGLPTLFSGSPFQIQNDTLFYNNFQHCAVAYYTHSLGGARWLAHYEAAKAVLPLRATITIRVTPELNTDQITPVDFGFAHNFSDTFGSGVIPIVEELAYRTNVNQSEPDYQQRINARPHGAFRSFEYHVSPASGAARARLQGELYAPAETYCVPLWRDVGVTTGSASSGTNTIPADTTKRRYEVGSYCGACTDPLNPLSFQFFKITAVADAQLTLATTIGATIPSGSFVFPAFLGTISDDSLAFQSFAADHEDSVLRFDALESELFTRDITEYTPSTAYLGIELFTLEAAKVPFLDARPYEIQRRVQGRGRDDQRARDTGSPQTFPVRFLLKDRDSLSQFYGWLDARQGRQNPLWVSTREKDLIPLSIPDTHKIRVRKSGFAFHHGRRHLEFLKTDGTTLRVGVTGVTDNGNNTEDWTLDLLFTIPEIASTVRISFLKYCTLASDTIQIRHWKGNVSESTISFRELLTTPAS